MEMAKPTSLLEHPVRLLMVSRMRALLLFIPVLPQTCSIVLMEQLSRTQTVTSVTI